MMFVQIKAIRKGIRPPRWRRAYIPLHITFTQLAYILEVMLELPLTDRFEFEFFQEKDRLIEARAGEESPYSYDYSYWRAGASCVNDWLMSKTWFTFRLREQKNQPEYRVECEKLFDDIRLGTEKLNYPVILKEVSVKEDVCWSNGTKINQILKKTCFLKEEKPGYPSFSEVSVRITNQQGIGTGRNIKSIDHLLRQSTRSLMSELGKTIVQLASQQQDIASFPKAVISSSRQTGRNTAALIDLLNSYTKEDLKDAAEETGCDLKGSTRPKMAFELARYLLEPNVMRTLLLGLTEEELDAFETAIERNRFTPTEEEWKSLAGAYDLNYVAEFTDETAEIPWDVAHIYGVICKNGYRKYHKDARWLTDCLIVFSLLFVTGPVKHLFRMYRQREGGLNDYKDFLKLLNQIPRKYNPCQLVGTKLVAIEAVKDNIYLTIEARQRDVPYYLPVESEIRELASNGYPASDPSYKKLFEFFQKEVDLETVVCKELCRSAFLLFSGGGMLSDFMEELENRKILLSSKGQAETFVKIIMDLNNHTRMYELKGHTPIEMRSFMPSLSPGSPPAIVPMSSMAAGMMEKSRKELQNLGFKVDTDMTAELIPTVTFPEGLSGMAKTGAMKIYPNDPCPCGSGKKYKKCCGRRI